jgi:hypothetical protein
LIEDILTSSVIGVLQYLPDTLFWEVIRGACEQSSDLPDSIGPIQEFHFWEKLPAKDNTYNSIFVEPDVWIEAGLCDIIIEAKRADSPSVSAQSERQWRDQIQSLLNYRSKYEIEDEKKIIYIALGGNTSVSNQIIPVAGEQYIIHNASWFNLLDSINKCRASLSEYTDLSHSRILGDAYNVLVSQGIFHTVWFDSFQGDSIRESSLYTLINAWNPDLSSNLFFSELFDNQNNNIINDNLPAIWQQLRI